MAETAVIARRLKEARKRAGISQKRLGILAGIDESSASPRINQYERGKHTPDHLTIARLAKVLKVPRSFFYAYDDNLAKIILHYGSLTAEERRRLVETVLSKKSKPV